MKLREEPFEIEIFGEKYIVQMVAGWYEDGTRGIQLIVVEDGSPFGKLTVSVPGTKLADDEILVKTWSENEPLAQAILPLGFFEDTGKRVRTGRVEAHVWRVL